MLLFAVVAGVVLLSGRAEAIKWDFDDWDDAGVGRQRSADMGGDA